MFVYLSLCELLSETESVEVWGGKCNLDLVYSSMEVLHLCLQIQYILKGDINTQYLVEAANTACIINIQYMLLLYTGGKNGFSKTLLADVD